jgi:uncharacterized membrane protein
MREKPSVHQWLSERSLFGVVAASCLAVAVLVTGPRLVGLPPTHRFLVWNLALAWVPYVAALALEQLHRARMPLAAAGAAVVWLLFLPNAPYLVTDLSHLHGPSTTPWLELARFVAFAWAGCLLAVASLRVIHRIVGSHVGRMAGWALVVGAAGVSGVGVVLGRFARLNSWEALTRPWEVAAEALRLAGSRQAIAVSLFFTFLLLVTDRKSVV